MYSDGNRINLNFYDEVGNRKTTAKMLENVLHAEKRGAVKQMKNNYYLLMTVCFAPFVCLTRLIILSFATFTEWEFQFTRKHMFLSISMCI